MTVRVESGTWSLTGTNGGSLGENSGILTREIDLDIDEVDEALELTFLVGDLMTWNFGLLYRLLLNNGLKMTPLLIDKLMTASTYFPVSLSLTSPR